MTEEARLRRKQRDHERYMAQREEWLVRQRSYYASNREACIASVKRAQKKRLIKELYGGE